MIGDEQSCSHLASRSSVLRARVGLSSVQACFQGHMPIMYRYGAILARISSQAELVSGRGALRLALALAWATRPAQDEFFLLHCLHRAGPH